MGGSMGFMAQGKPKTRLFVEFSVVCAGRIAGIL